MTRIRRPVRLRLAAVVAAAITAVGCATTATSEAGKAAPGPSKPAPAPSESRNAGAAPSARSYAPVIEQVLPSVVLLRTEAGLGSGVILDEQGHIVTNAHVVGDAATVQVQLSGDPDPRPATVVASYRPDDLAVLRTADTSGMKPARLGDSDQVRVGDVVLAIGNPLGLTGSVTSGIISATDRAVTGQAGPDTPSATLPGALQTSAPINPGNSGGALADLSGRVIGIPTLAAANPANGAPAAGIGFAIPSNLVRDIAGQIIRTGHVVNSHRAALGIQAATVSGPDGSAAGAGIAAVTPGGPAQKAGLRQGDVIRAVGDSQTPTAGALAEALAALWPGQAVSLTVVRGDGQLTVPVTLGQLPGS